MPYHIQNIRTGKFVEFYIPNRGLIETDDKSRAVKYPHFGHASQVVFWNLDFMEEWRIINCDTLDSYVRDETGWKLENKEEQRKKEDDNSQTKEHCQSRLLQDTREV